MKQRHGRDCRNRLAWRLCSLDQIDPDRDHDFGGKALGLARLLRAGVLVPLGFATSAVTSIPELWTEEERGLFAAAASELLEWGPVAVRSSAIGEDSQEQSFAGQLESVLGIDTLDALLSAAGHCVASGDASRVRAYAGLGSAVPVGLVVQSMVSCRVAGVCFTRDPAGKDRAVLVEGVSGSGEGLVSGLREPEHWRVYGTGLGGLECLSRGPACGLGQTSVETIAGLALKLDVLFGEALGLDLEWAIDHSGELWWLQARPITTAVDPPQYAIRRSYDEADDGPVTVWSNWNVRETMPDPWLPLTWGYWREVLMPILVHQVSGVPPASALNRELMALDLLNGRVYFNMNGVLATPIIGPLACHAIGFVDAEAAQVLRGLRATGVLQPRRLGGSKLALTPRLLLATFLGLLRFTRALRPRRALAVLEHDGQAIARRAPVGDLSNVELIEEMRLWGRPECRRLLDGLQMEGLAMAIYGLASRVFRSHRTAMGLLATGIPANPTTQISLAIEHLVENARPLAELFLEDRPAHALLEELAVRPDGPPWLELLAGFLDRFGHRGPMEFDLGAPRWSDDPTMIVELVRAGLRSVREGIGKRMIRLGEDRDRALTAALAASSRWRRPVMCWLARLVELYMPLREAPKHYGLFVFDRARRAALEIGKRLSRDDLLDSPDDVFLLEWPELSALADGRPGLESHRQKVAERRVQYQRFLDQPAPDFLRSDGVPVDLHHDLPGVNEHELVGTGVSAGRATGRVKVLSEPDPRAIADGDVIVMRFADPGWTPLFPRAAAVVMEVGGLMCHAAVVAREMGIPAVFGVRLATEVLSDGEQVEVDGSRGVITRLTALSEHLDL
ncbi:MAG: hypothetical protein K8R59_02780 [Thermoanaerobaculales bacterium]|nr:hypothetical protein [Thermoanaerobaculales bacterium]